MNNGKKGIHSEYIEFGLVLRNFLERIYIKTNWVAISKNCIILRGFS